jgi:hypothetical protein
MKLPTALRDQIATEFRERLCQKLSLIPFLHQRAWWAAGDGQILLDEATAGPDRAFTTTQVRLPDDAVVSRALLPRPYGRARVIVEMGGFKSGKSFGGALWLTGFAAVPGARVRLIGVEYDMVSPEFEYLLEFLLSDRGMRLPVASLQNRPKDGRMWLELKNGARFEARSWERQEAMKGKESDVHYFAEAYQLPGLECHTSISQNLTAREGYAVFTTTPDEPWLAILHERGHGDPDFADWACFCGIPRQANPYTYSERTMRQDQQIMTREKFAVAYHGQIGEYVGRVFSYQRGQRLIDPQAHTELFIAPAQGCQPNNVRVPHGWRIEVGADTGTFCGAVLVAFDPEGTAYVLDEMANYWYLSGTPELDPQTSLVTWADRFARMCALWGARPLGWCDLNSQFRREMSHYKIALIGNPVTLDVRTEVARQYFQHNRVWFAPWLKILPYEIEHARWPEQASASGKFVRLKSNDHLLDGLEHVLSRHPRGKVIETQTTPRGYRSPYRIRAPQGNPHLGRY